MRAYPYTNCRVGKVGVVRGCGCVDVGRALYSVGTWVDVRADPHNCSGICRGVVPNGSGRAVVRCACRDWFGQVAVSSVEVWHENCIIGAYLQGVRVVLV